MRFGISEGEASYVESFPPDMVGCGTSGNVYIRHDMTDEAKFVAVKAFHDINSQNIDFAIQEVKVRELNYVRKCSEVN